MIQNAVSLGRPGMNLEFSLIDDAADALAPGSCDAIVCSSVIEYVRDPDTLLQQFRAALRQPGALIISYANRSSLWRWWWDKNGAAAENPMYVPHHQAWHWSSFRALLARNGFRATIGPRFFESPLDLFPGRRLFRWLAIGGTLGMLTAQPVSRDP
jgi:SAM-dependent methyltransferase